jgi:hypothetical protein
MKATHDNPLQLQAEKIDLRFFLTALFRLTFLNAEKRTHSKPCKRYREKYRNGDVAQGGASCLKLQVFTNRSDPSHPSHCQKKRAKNLQPELVQHFA